MRRWMRIIGGMVLSLASLQTLIALIDWLGRWDWIKAFLLAHPHFALFIHTPLFTAALIVGGFALLWSERRVKEPRLVARYVNSRWLPDLHSVSMRVYAETEHEAPGWDEHKLNWDGFLEVQMVNDSDTSTTIDNVELNLTVKRKWWGKRQQIEARYLNDLEQFDIDITRNANGTRLNRPSSDRPLVGFMDQIRDKLLQKEISYRGWLHVKVFDVTQREISKNQININVILRDAMQRPHRLILTKKDEKKWDLNFFIFPR